MKKIDDIEIAKMLLDQRKRSILDIAKIPVTVSQIAEELGEKQSRLYYHVKKLEEAGLLELVETRQHGNLIEKYYQRNKSTGSNFFQFDENLLKNHHDTLMEQIMKVLEPGLNLVAKELQLATNDPAEENVNLMIHFSELTREQWSLSQERIMKAVKAHKIAPEEAIELTKSTVSLVDPGEKSKYAYFLLSYKVDEAADDENN
ncbi:MAG: winged helix-turn-helix domain-containing protein [Bacillota bacterium]|nr:winged helix-turn-helix domain-containing protein [Bacillota bacterium]